ncbi:tRNA pseudouridine(38-40) synthase TruA [Desulfonema ishimotonii]|uniref:tRNA pseudouridine synthase A n=1 Tax=Desulfonema ishimotonii TaxID=45657 RepID=A0A401FRG2_9BACT|nr:tRNA pseudouridine(38-40) synthase TruA [Desulfonema ishimotonii]GBC59551.1 tRNA pseudouridine(38-40) synthase TruA [Desulfonema ishimotonii]
MKNFRLIIEYDGTAYHGWQIQKDDRTIQGEIQNALERMTRRKIVLNGSGRTDAGVHALGQVASFRCDTRLTAEAFQKGLNSILDDDIVIHGCREVPETFHARFDARGKTYHYRILNRPLPSAIDRRSAWFIKRPLDFSAMQAAAGHIPGEHDFKAFEGTGSPRAHTVRRVSQAGFVRETDGYLTFRISANGFLRFMVRNIVGTLAEVGMGKRTPDRFKAVLLSKDRGQAGATAPPQGLCLMHVNYEEGL